MPYFTEADSAGFIGDVPDFCPVERCGYEAEFACDNCGAEYCEQHAVEVAPNTWECPDCAPSYPSRESERQAGRIES